MKYYIVYNEIDDKFKVINKNGHVISGGKTQEEAINGAVDCFNINVEDIKIDSTLI